jgi:REP element-mobilizing transposase RayT
MSRRTPRQLRLALAPRRGGFRSNAGRKPTIPGRPGVPHRARPFHDHSHPLHVTLRVARDLPNLRDRDLARAFARQLRATSSEAFRVVHFSLQGDHVHLIVEAKDTRELVRGMRRLTIRVALAWNRALGHKGQVFVERYHARALRTPREVRNVIVYVLRNWAKHRDEATRGVDPFSSGWWFDGWRERWHPPPQPAPTPRPRTWLLATGWRRNGLVSFDEAPAQARPRA